MNEGNPLDPGGELSRLISSLEDLPDQIHDALYAWRRATLDFKRVRGLCYLRHKFDAPKPTVSEIEALTDTDEDVYNAKLNEAVKEALYVKLYESLMSAKHLSNLRKAF